MIHQTFNHRLNSGEDVKFTIIEEVVDEEILYSCRVININLESYQKLDKYSQSKYLGAHVTDGENNTVYYHDPSRLKSDLILKYGNSWLKSETSIS
jgi:hypothetical protein